MSLLCRDNIESLARRGKSASSVPVALCTTEFRCLVKRSLGKKCIELRGVRVE